MKLPPLTTPLVPEQPVYFAPFVPLAFARGDYTKGAFLLL